MPTFAEGNIDAFFDSFERMARSQRWPTEQWPALLQQALTGKAQRTLASLSDEDANSNDTIKAEVLSAYALVPEAYRTKFRNLRIKAEQAYVEFASESREALHR